LSRVFKHISGQAAQRVYSARRIGSGRISLPVYSLLRVKSSNRHICVGRKLSTPSMLHKTSIEVSSEAGCSKASLGELGTEVCVPTKSDSVGTAIQGSDNPSNSEVAYQTRVPFSGTQNSDMYKYSSS